MTHFSNSQDYSPPPGGDVLAWITSANIRYLNENRKLLFVRTVLNCDDKQVVYANEVVFLYCFNGNFPVFLG